MRLVLEVIVAVLVLVVPMCLVRVVVAVTSLVSWVVARLLLGPCPVVFRSGLTRPDSDPRLVCRMLQVRRALC